MNKLVKLSDEHYIIINDSEIKEGDIIWRLGELPLKVTPNFFWDFQERYYKVTHSTLFYLGTIPLKLDYIEKVIWDVSTYDLFKEIDGSCEENEYEHYLFKSGFKAHKKLTEDKLFTKNDLIDFAEKCLTVANNTDNMYRLRRFVIDQAESLKPKTEWNIEIVDNKIKLI